jgi:hypothetical protein
LSRIDVCKPEGLDLWIAPGEGEAEPGVGDHP